ncbi:MAG: hypothetical protein VCD33_01120 [Alphaproteobacteria bacterium]|jgi:hypothetical protein
MAIDLITSASFPLGIGAYQRGYHGRAEQLIELPAPGQCIENVTERAATSYTSSRKTEKPGPNPWT